MKPKCITHIRANLLIMFLLASPTFAQTWGTLWTYPVPSQTQPMHYFCGAANMDEDPGEELVYWSNENRVIIFDGATGNPDWDSGIWTFIQIAGKANTGIIYGYTPFCDINGDGKKEITFEGRPIGVNDWTIYVVGFTGGSGINTGGFQALPLTPTLNQNYPNPFNPATAIAYELTAPGLVSLIVYNLTGQKIRTLVNEAKPAGEYTALWDGRDDAGNSLSSGTYFYQLQAGDYVSTLKSILLK